MSDSLRVPRRHVLKILGAATVAPAVAEGARLLHPFVPPQPDGGPWRPRYFTDAEVRTVETVAELIIPETDTPGARTAHVHQYIDWVVSRAAERDAGDPNLASTMRDGLAWLDHRSDALYGKAFIATTADQQTALLTRLAADPAQEDDTGVTFFTEARRLTIRGYYRSEIGMTEELGYAGKQYLAEFGGCTDHEHLAWEPETPAPRER